ncbi:hypothetical protein [Streptomyces sp. G45]|uniref:hypothetical protein n=1 Tax=Streptomyces sp. G45 TaxID=3406627 RepID=UPI003C16AEEB
MHTPDPRGRGRHPTRGTGRRLRRAALFSAVRGAAMTAGSTAVAALVWWLRGG